MPPAAPRLLPVRRAATEPHLRCERESTRGRRTTPQRSRSRPSNTPCLTAFAHAAGGRARPLERANEIADPSGRIDRRSCFAYKRSGGWPHKALRVIIVGFLGSCCQYRTALRNQTHANKEHQDE